MHSTKYVFALATVMSVALSPSLFAGGPFGLFDGCNKSCDSMCGSSCDGSACGGACCDGGGCDSGCSKSGCGLFSCGLFGNKGCDSGCDSGCCDSGCDSGCSKSGCGLFSCGLFGNKGCDSGCDSGCCDSGCDSACGKSGCSLFGCGLFGNKGCDSGCDSGCCDSGCGGGCDSGCDSMGCLSGGCGSYISLFGGWNVLDDFDDTLVADMVSAKLNDGLALGGAIGRRFGTSFRGELETSVRINTGDTVFDGTDTFDLSGHAYTYAGMANLYYDMHQLEMLGITPYAGAGLGLAVVRANFDTEGVESNIDDESFAYQFIAGGSKRLNSNVAMFAEYRYFNIDSLDLEIPSAGLTFSGDDVQADTFLFGLRINR